MNILDFKSINKQLNNLTFTQYYYDLTLLALSLFEWKNLPNHINERWIEKYLFSEGECMFFKDDDKGLMVAKCTRDGVNNYDEPISLRPYANNFVNSEPYKLGSECVLIRNNDLSIPTELKIKLIAHRLADITRTIDINIHAQKTPILIKCRDRQRLTLRNVYEQYDGNKPIIYADKEADLDGFEVLKTDAPYVADKLQIQKHQIMNEFLTFIGINNANMDKKERLVDDEVQANNEEVESFFNCMFKARKQACKEINELFGTNIKVERRTQKWADFEGQIDDSEDSDKEVA